MAVITQFVYWKIADGTEGDTDFVFDPEGTTVGGVWVGRPYHFSGVHSAPIEGIASTQGITGAVNAPTVTPLGANRLGVSLVCVAENGTIGPFTGESGGDWVEAVAEYVNGGGDNASLQLQIVDLSAGTPISGGSVTPSKVQAWTVDAFALVPILTAVNTIEYGAVDWNVEEGAPVAGSGMLGSCSYT